MAGVLNNYRALELPALPIDACLAELLECLSADLKAVLVAPPGAGKTSRVPLALLGQPWAVNSKILVVQPRRLAARSAAHHMAHLLKEPVGKTIGYSVRMDSKVSAQTRIEFVTDGVFTRKIINDPELTGVAAVLFDEIHERSLNMDLGLALALDTANALRSDLRLLPMSATLDGANVASLLAQVGEPPAKLVQSEGRTFPISYRYVPKTPNECIEDAMVRSIRNTLKTEEGSVLCFLPGQAEINRVKQRLEDLEGEIEICPLYGALDQQSQTRAIQPVSNGKRKIVLATSIAETSLTIEGIRIVIDSGLARVPRFETATGLTRLATVKAAKSSIDQRAGRAGRTEPGITIRLWHEGQTASLPEYERPQILEADLSNLVLDLASWGVKEPSEIRLLDQPPQQTWAEAKSALIALGAIDAAGNLTKRGKDLVAFPLAPRLGHMVYEASAFSMAQEAALLSVLIEERGLGGNDVDLSERLRRVKNARDQRSKNAVKAAHRILKNLDNSQTNTVETHTVGIGAVLSFAWPERIAQRVSQAADGAFHYRLVNGRRARLEAGSPLGSEQFLVVADLQGSATSGRIVAAVSLQEQEIRLLHDAQIVNERILEFDQSSSRLKVKEIERIGALELTKRAGKLLTEDEPAERLIEQLKQDGLERLPFGKAEAFRTQVNFLHSIEPDSWPSFDLESLKADLEEWLLPMIPGASSYAEISPDKILEGLKLHLGQDGARLMKSLLPKTLLLPSGKEHRLEYRGASVVLSAKVQEFFGMKTHPTIMNGKLPLTLELLSPAMRPIQTTQDISRFWQGSWKDVRSDLRGRYPKHDWPQDPSNAQATSKAKPRNGK